MPVGRGLLVETRRAVTRHPRAPQTYKRVELHPFVSSAAVQLPNSTLQPSQLLAWRRYLFFLTTLSIIMFSKTILTSLVVGAISVNALTIPVAREPAPESECESP